MVSLAVVRCQQYSPLRALQASAVLRRASDEHRKEPLASSSQQHFDSPPDGHQPEEKPQGPHPR